MPKPETPPSSTSVLCLLPEQRWRLDTLEAALSERGTSLRIHCCDPAMESASALLAEGRMQGVTAVLYCDTIDRFADLGQADNITEFLQALRERGCTVVSERFALGGPFDDEAVTTTDTRALVQALLGCSAATR